LRFLEARRDELNARLMSYALTIDEPDEYSVEFGMQ
jgi:hypothetical protein